MNVRRRRSVQSTVFARASPRAGRLRALLLIALVGVSASAVLLWMRAERTVADREPRAPVFDTDPDVAGWSGEIELESGERLVARLTRLHAQPELQRFDALALRRRLDLAEGEPWRVDLRLFASRANAQNADASSASASALALRSVRVRDADGQAQHELADTSFPDRSLIDPLTVLLAPPASDLHPGEAVTLFLWGREPRGDVAIEGLTQATIALSPSKIRRSEVESSLARLDRALPARPRAPAKRTELAPR